jgi:hypothetical protein
MTYQAGGVSGTVTYAVSYTGRVQQVFEFDFTNMGAIGSHRIIGDPNSHQAQSVITLGRKVFETSIQADLNTKLTTKYYDKRNPANPAIPFAKLLDMAADLAEVPTICGLPRGAVKKELKPLAPAPQ